MLDLEAIRQNMTRERAEFVKKRMQDEGTSWRSLTFDCWRAWGEPEWILPGNQFWGKAILDVAGEILGEHPLAW